MRITYFLFILASISLQKSTAQTVPVTLQTFYDELSPYGTWIIHKDYGYAWIPDAEAGFAPYSTNGSWTYTNEGWTWVSNYSWGWAPFHYGRWFTDPIYGPTWIPGNEWSPAWVSWRKSDEYFGWAPIGPGISIDSANSENYKVPVEQWRFVKRMNFARSGTLNYFVSTSRNQSIIENTTVINTSYESTSNKVKYNAGPDKIEVDKRGGKPLSILVIKEREKPGLYLNNDQVEIYRPLVLSNSPGTKKPAPLKVTGLKEVKTLAQKTSNQTLQTTLKAKPSEYTEAGKIR